MPRTCTVCSHGSRRKIDKAIVSGTPYRDIAGHFGISRTALSRHKSHVLVAIERASQKRELSIGDSVLTRLESLYRHGLALLDKAEAGKNLFAAVACVRELRGILGAVHQLAGEAVPKPATMPLQEEYVAAISRALGMTGELRPIGRRPDVAGLLPSGNGQNGDGRNAESTIDVDILPQD